MSTRFRGMPGPIHRANIHRANIQGSGAAMRTTEGMQGMSTRILALTLGAALLLGEVALAAAQAPPGATPGGSLRLEDLERMAPEKNPTLSQAQSSLPAGQGGQTQAGLYPNPLVGYHPPDHNTPTPPP